MFKRLLYSTQTALGSDVAQGRLQRLQTKEHLWKEWKKACGTFDWKPTFENVCTYVGKYNLDLTHLNIEPQKRMSKEQLDGFFDELAKKLIAAGAVSFG